MRQMQASAAGRMLAEPGTYFPAGVEPAKSGRNPALSRNCDAPTGDEPGRLLHADGRQLSTEGRFAWRRQPPPPTGGGPLVGRKHDRRGRPTSKLATWTRPVTKRESIGVGVVVVRGNEVLFGLRRGAHGAGTWSFPGGHVDDGENVEECALRELEEETGLAAVNPRRVGETEDVFAEGLRYRTIFVRVNWAGGEPALREPEACERWRWFAWDDPPAPLFLPVANLRATGYRPASAQSEHVRAPRPHKTATPAKPTAATGVVEVIHIAPAAGAPVRAVDAVQARAGVGLDGDRYADGRGHYQDARVSRDLTLIEAETLEALTHDHGINLAPGETRRNITTRGISLNELVGRRFWVGHVLCQGTRLCEPCQYLAELTGKPLLRALVHRGGLRADILHGGFIRHGDSVRVVDGD